MICGINIREYSSQRPGKWHEAHAAQVQDVQPQERSVNHSHVVKLPVVSEPEDAEDNETVIQERNFGMRDTRLSTGSSCPRNPHSG